MRETDHIDELIEEMKEYNDMLDNNKNLDKTDTKQNDEDNLDKTKIIEGNVSEDKISNNKNNNKSKKEIEEDKKLNKTIVIVVCCVIAVTILVILFLVILAKNRSKTISDDNLDILTKEEYKTIVKEYGDAATKSVEEYMDSYGGSVPLFKDIEEDIFYPAYKVTCTKSIVNFDGSVYLNDCSIKGYSNKFNYSYGKFLEKETDNKDVTNIFIYKTVEDNYYSYYALNNKIEETNSIKLIDTYSCSEKDCFGYHGSSKNTKDVVIRDGDYYLYNPVTKEKRQLSGFGSEKYQSIYLYGDKYENSYAMYIVKKDGTGAFYKVDKGIFVTDFIYSASSNSTKLLSSGYFAGIKERKGNSSVYIINQNTGEEVFTFDGALYIKDQVVGNTNLYFLGNTNYGEISGCFLNTSFKKIVPNLDYYNFSINSDNTITVKNKNTFERYDVLGNKVFESSMYTEILKVLENYVIVRTDKEVKILDGDGKLVSNFFKTKDSYKYYSDLSYINIKGSEKGIYFVVEDTSIGEGVEGRGLKYFYNIDTKEIKVDKLSTIVWNS